VVDDMGGPRRMKFMGHYVVKHVNDMYYQDFRATFQKFIFEVLYMLSLVGLKLKDDTHD
jgi:hypothetical protein